VKSAIVLAASLLIAGCASVQQAPAPDAADVHRFIPSERRLDVLPEMADPIAAGPDSAAICLAVERRSPPRYRVGSMIARPSGPVADPSCRTRVDGFVPALTSL